MSLLFALDCQKRSATPTSKRALSQTFQPTESVVLYQHIPKSNRRSAKLSRRSCTHGSSGHSLSTTALRCRGSLHDAADHDAIREVFAVIAISGGCEMVAIR
jgi:hypothetical protein